MKEKKCKGCKKKLILLHFYACYNSNLHQILKLMKFASHFKAFEICRII